MVKKVLVLNMGMKSIRSILFDSDGNKLATASAPLTTALNDELVTQDPEEWWDKACEVVRQSVKGESSDTIDYMAVTASAACLLAIDKYGNPITKCVMVSDRRAAEESKELSEAKSYKDVRFQTGLRMDTHMLLPKLLWVRKHQADIYDRAAYFLSPNDYLIRKLTGDKLLQII